MTKFAGISIQLNGVAYVVPPLNLRSVQELQDRIAKFKGGVDSESVTLIIDCAHAALIRNYPDISKADLAEWLDLGNMEDIFQAVMDVSGLKRKSMGESSQGELLTNL